jgi:hypothetical protein
VALILSSAPGLDEVLHSSLAQQSCTAVLHSSLAQQGRAETLPRRASSVFLVLASKACSTVQLASTLFCGCHRLQLQAAAQGRCGCKPQC